MKSLVYITGSITFADLEAGRVSDIDVLDAQVKNWLLRPAAHLAAMTPTIGEQYEHGMSLFALELMFFEPHGQYLGGNDSQGQSGKMFLLAFERFRAWLGLCHESGLRLTLERSRPRMSATGLGTVFFIAVKSRVAVSLCVV
jgi:hypothetical protein